MSSTKNRYYLPQFRKSGKKPKLLQEKCGRVTIQPFTKAIGTYGRATGTFVSYHYGVPIRIRFKIYLRGKYKDGDILFEFARPEGGTFVSAKQSFLIVPRYRQYGYTSIEFLCHCKRYTKTLFFGEEIKLACRKCHNLNVLKSSSKNPLDRKIVKNPDLVREIIMGAHTAHQYKRALRIYFSFLEYWTRQIKLKP